MKIGRKLAIKILNASKFVLSVAGERLTTRADDALGRHRPLDRSMLAALADLVADATEAFDAFDYARALERTERFFWSFCDDYVELVKNRAYGARRRRRSAAPRRPRCAPRSRRCCALFAPILPFVTEEVWSWWPRVRCTAPTGRPPTRCASPTATPLVFEVAADVLAAVRKAEVGAEAVAASRRCARSSCTTRPTGWPRSRRAEGDLCEAGKIATLSTAERRGAARRGRARRRPNDA